MSAMCQDPDCIYRVAIDHFQNVITAIRQGYVFEPPEKWGRLEGNTQRNIRDLPVIGRVVGVYAPGNEFEIIEEQVQASGQIWLKTNLGWIWDFNVTRYLKEGK